MFEGYIKGKKIKRKLSSEDLYSFSEDNFDNFQKYLELEK